MAAMKGEGRVGLMQISTLGASENLHLTLTTTNFHPNSSMEASLLQQQVGTRNADGFWRQDAAASLKRAKCTC
ncbi:hypothetical protein PFLUV_G00084100 [Perca fluviatilis]|uniref:Uncharacterized protein n=1 Tax=Perca fluviatilis TaxID=8168 RepID=A0A6A5F3K5_PERFL|nr:hypothetical protein PFLUV_G00084100 [Perca fluviatilis]